MKTLIPAITLVMACIAVAACELPTDPEPTSGAIYFRLEQDLGNGQALWCDMPSGEYSDTNPDVPNNAAMDVNYGPSEPGTYQAEFTFDVTGELNERIAFSYTLQEPPAGYVRYYTKQLRDYNSQLNRCVDVSRQSNTLTYRDEPI